MVEQPPLRGEGIVEHAVVVGEAGGADVLRHADRGDRVEALVAELPVVLKADVHPVGDAGIDDALAGEVGLSTADGDADDRHVMVERGVDGH